MRSPRSWARPAAAPEWGSRPAGAPSGCSTSAAPRRRWRGCSPRPVARLVPQPSPRSLPMRIALLCSDLGIPLGGAKGASVHLRAVASVLLRAGHHVTAMLAAPGPESAYVQLAERGLELRVLRQPRTVRKLEWHFAQVKPDLVLERLSLLAPEGALAAAEAGVPHVFEVNAPLD